MALLAVAMPRMYYTLLMEGRTKHNENYISISYCRMWQKLELFHASHNQPPIYSSMYDHVYPELQSSQTIK